MKKLDIIIAILLIIATIVAYSHVYYWTDGARLASKVATCIAALCYSTFVYNTTPIDKNFSGQGYGILLVGFLAVHSIFIF